MSFKLRVEGGARLADRDEIRRALGVLIDPGQTFELRGLPSGRSRVCRGSDLDAATEAAVELSDGQVYWTLNPCRADLTRAAANGDILSRRWFPIDIDPVKPADLSASDEEKAAAVDLMVAIANYLASEGWPGAVWADSGNGGHLLYPVAMAADKATQELMKRAMIGLATKFDTDRAKVDRSVHNAARIFKLPGSYARKGPNTPDRPHRMARLVAIPNDLSNIVTAEMLGALAGMAAGGNTTPTERRSPSPPPSANGPSNGHAPFVTRANGNGISPGYVDQAIRNECNRVLFARPGAIEGRNIALNLAAFNLGTMADWPEMDVHRARASLRQAALQAGLGERETDTTIESGWNGGRGASPRKRPEPAKPNGKPKAAAPGPNEPLTIGLDEVQNEIVDWVWENRIARKFISIFAGKTSAAKSFVMCDVSAHLSRGEAPPFSALKAQAMRTLFISEDPLGPMLAPRLRELRATEPMIRFMRWRAMASFVLSDTAMLDRLKQEHDFDLLIIDPPANFLGATDEHKNAEVRSMLMGLVAWLEENNVACVLISHINKQVGKGLDAIERIIGSVAWASVARITVAFAPDPDDSTQMVMGGTKNNLGEKAQPLNYRVVKTAGLATIQWIGVSATTIEDAMNKIKRKTRGVCAVEWLEERFREKREWASEDLKQAASEFGLSKNALWSDEVNGLPIRKVRRVDANGDAAWYWIAKPDWPLPDTNQNVGNVGNVATQAVNP